MATHSSTLAWRIPWTENPGGLQSTGLQRVRHFHFLSAYTLRAYIQSPWEGDWGSDLWFLAVVNQHEVPEENPFFLCNFHWVKKNILPFPQSLNFPKRFMVSDFSEHSDCVAIFLHRNTSWIYFFHSLGLYIGFLKPISINFYFNPCHQNCLTVLLGECVIPWFHLVTAKIWGDGWTSVTALRQTSVTAPWLSSILFRQ